MHIHYTRSLCYYYLLIRRMYVYSFVHGFFFLHPLVISVSLFLSCSAVIPLGLQAPQKKIRFVAKNECIRYSSAEISQLKRENEDGIQNTTIITAVKTTFKVNIINTLKVEKFEQNDEKKTRMRSRGQTPRETRLNGQIEFQS